MLVSAPQQQESGLILCFPSPESLPPRPHPTCYVVTELQVALPVLHSNSHYFTPDSVRMSTLLSQLILLGGRVQALLLGCTCGLWGRLEVFFMDTYKGSQEYQIF